MDDPRSYGEASLAELQVNEEHWGLGAESIVKEWLAAHYNPSTMPTLQVGRITGREGLWLLGWDAKGTSWPPLLELIFGEDYARSQLAQIDTLIENLQETVLCPRCGVRRYTPPNGRPTASAPFPALSRVDNATYICTWCGTDEAMRDASGEPPVGPDQWPMIPPGSFGQGRL